jgi:DNA-binding response OmpR family regulator
LPRLNASLPRPIIIAASARAFDSDIRQSMLAGADAFITKPIEISRLLALLETHLSLEWIRQTPAPKPAKQQLVSPPPAEMAVLYDLAMKGELLRLKERAEQIARLDDAYRPFAQNYANCRTL